MMKYKVLAFKGKNALPIIKEQIVQMNQTFGWTKQQSEENFQQPHTEYYCLVDKQEVIGFVSLHHLLDECSILHVFIESTYRQQKLATALMLYVLKQLEYREVKHVFLEVRISNQAAIRLYQACGFETLTIRKNYYTNPVEDALLMQKKL